MFKFKIIPDRHNAIQKLNYCVLPHPAHFSLPSTFKQLMILIMQTVHLLQLDNAGKDSLAKGNFYKAILIYF
jgi:hypothetical protein